MAKELTGSGKLSDHIRRNGTTKRTADDVPCRGNRVSEHLQAVGGATVWAAESLGADIEVAVNDEKQHT